MNRLRRLLLLPLLLAAALMAGSWTVGAQAKSAAPPPCHETQAPTAPDGHRDGVLARLACALHCAGCLVGSVAQPERASPTIVRPLAIGAATPESRAPDRLDRPPKPA